MGAPFFDGRQHASAPPIARGVAEYELVEPSDRPVRHLAGYEPFIALLNRRQIDAMELSGDPLRLVGVISQLAPDIGSSTEVRHAAALFFGNALVAARADAGWRQYGDSFPSAGAGRQWYEVDRVVQLILNENDAWVDTFQLNVAMWLGD
ncbi:hypothetical protein FDM98_07930 [Microbacterium sp. TL13]|uniref:hypothetical protein n=1 Tax=Microbacterium sp. TL13 TaxID=2576306 RepID=UPI00136C1B2A|nr:hypothetical protein [Microbacterium sp. TL13]MXS74588.1 hypothetical protein [Microbacterium sp. TL13]